MASYIESSLGRSERIVYKAQVSWLSQFWGIVFGILLLMWVIGIVLIVSAVLNVMTTELALTNKRRPLQNSPKSPKFPPRHLGDFS